MEYDKTSQNEARVEAIMEQIRQNIRQRHGEERGTTSQPHPASMNDVMAHLNLNTNTLPSGPIPSHRRGLGPFIILAKRILRKLMMPYTRLALREQITFNARLQTAIRDTVTRIAERIDAVHTTAHATIGQRVDDLQQDIQKAQHELSQTIQNVYQELNQDLQKAQEHFATRSNSLDAYLQILQRRIAEREEQEEEEKSRNRDSHAQLQNTHQQVQQQFQDAHQQVRQHFQALFQALEERHRELFDQYLEQRQENLLQKRRLDIILTELRQKAGLGEEEVQRIAAHSEHLRDHQYFLFENKFRGPREAIRTRQEVYLPLFKEIHQAVDSSLPVLDVGCGRGEFLELLRDAGIAAKGIELNEDMIHVCRERGLDVIQEDAFQYLGSLPDESLAGVMASHFAEHLDTEGLIRFATLCHRKIRKGGMVALETPNPLTLLVSANYFWLDLSHTRPIHPEALQFLLESCGFLDPRVIYLSPCHDEVKFRLFDAGEDQKLQAIRKNFEMLNGYFFGDQDYAVTARK